MADTQTDTPSTTSWTGGSGSWDDPAFWTDGVPTAVDIASFLVGTRGTVGDTGAAAQIQVAGEVSLTGTVTLSGALSAIGSGSATLTSTSNLQATGPVSVASHARLTDEGILESGSSVINGTVELDSSQALHTGHWTVDGTLEIAGGVVIVKDYGQVETDGVTIDGKGTLLLDPSASVTGGFTLNNGTLETTATTAVTGSVQPVVSITRTLTLAGADDVLSIGANDTLVIKGPVVGGTADGLQIAGSGSVELDGNNSFIGGVVIGTTSELVLGSANAVSNGAIKFVPAVLSNPTNPLSKTVGGVLGGAIALLDGLDLSGSGFGLGNGLDFRDLSLQNASTPDAAPVTTSYDATTGRLTVESGVTTVATLTLPTGLTGMFSVARDGQGGTTITLVHGKSDAIATATRSTQATEIYGVTGADVTVGVISDSFNAAGGLAQDISDGALPTAVSVVTDIGSAGETDEGRAMAQLIHDIAPDAAIAYASPSGNAGIDQDMAKAINSLVMAGAKVIVDDLGDAPGGFYSVGSATAAAIQNAINQHVVLVTSATNRGDVFYEHALNATAVTLPGGSADLFAYDFGGTGTGDSTLPYLQEIEIRTNATQYLNLQWQSSDSSLILTPHFFTKTGSTYTSVILTNSGTETQPVYQFTGTGVSGYANYYVAFTSSVADPSGIFKYTITPEATPTASIIDASDAGIGSGTITGHQLDPNEITVAAANYMTTLPGQTPTVEDFSASGPGMLLQADSTFLTLSKPDITAPDGTSTTVTDPSATLPDGVAGLSAFDGTSAAAPAFAGVAALMLQANPSLTSGDLLNLAKDSAISMAEPTRTGAGLVQADLAVGYAKHNPIVQFTGGNTTLLGTSGDDSIITNSGATTVKGGAGSDTISAGGQSTSIVGGSGRLLVTVASGSVSLSGGTGSATVSGGTGDLLTGGSAGDNMLTGGGHGAIWGGGTGDLLTGGVGDLIGTAASGNTTLVGGNGNVLVDGGQTLSFTGDDATLFGATSGGQDTVVGTGSFEDIGRGGQTTVFGGTGNGVTWGNASVITDVAGTGQGTLVAGTGHADLWIGATSGAQSLLAVNQAGGGSVDVFGFREGVDSFSSAGYAAGSSAATVGNGSLTLVLSDQTSITFVGVAALT